LRFLSNVQGKRDRAQADGSGDRRAPGNTEGKAQAAKGEKSDPADPSSGKVQHVWSPGL